MFQEEKLKQLVREYFEYDSSGHGMDHILRVVNTAVNIAIIEGADVELVKLIAYIHDVDDVKLVSSTHEYFTNGRSILSKINLEHSTIELIKDEVAALSFRSSGSTVCKTLEGKIVQDADRIDAMGAIGIARAFAYGGNKQREMFDRNNNLSTEAHFYQKLLKLQGLMNTKTGKELAQKRHQFMLDYLRQLEDELISKG